MQTIELKENNITEDLHIIEKYLCKNSLKYLCKEVLKFKDWDIVHDDLVEFNLKNSSKRLRLYLLPRDTSRHQF